VTEKHDSGEQACSTLKMFGLSHQKFSFADQRVCKTLYFILFMVVATKLFNQINLVEFG